MAWSGALGSLALVRGERGELAYDSMECLARQRHRRAVSLTPLSDGVSLLNKRTKSVDYSTLKGGDSLIPLLQGAASGAAKRGTSSDMGDVDRGIVVPAICVRSPSFRLTGLNDR